MDYNKLRTFMIVAREGSVTRAAHLVGRTQSAVTQQVTSLEGEIGLNLFERRKGRLFLTQAGRALFESSRTSFGALEGQLAQLRGGVGMGEEILTVGVSQDLATYFFCERVEEFRRQHPNVSLRLHFRGDPELELALSEDKLDLALITSFKDRKFFEVAEVLRMEEFPLASKAYADSRNFRRAEDLLSADLLDFTPDFACWGVWFRKNAPELLPELYKRRPVLCAPSHEVLLRGLRLGGVAMLPTHLATNDLVRLFPKSQPTRVGIDLARRRRGNPSPVHRALWDYLVAN